MKQIWFLSLGVFSAEPNEGNVSGGLSSYHDPLQVVLIGADLSGSFLFAVNRNYNFPLTEFHFVFVVLNLDSSRA